MGKTNIDERFDALENNLFDIQQSLDLISESEIQWYEPDYAKQQAIKAKQSFVIRHIPLIASTRNELDSVQAKIDAVKAADAAYPKGLLEKRTALKQKLDELEQKYKAESELRDRFVGWFIENRVFVSRDEALAYYEANRFAIYKGYPEFIVGTVPECWLTL
jgi:hypothetical protein